MTVDLARRDRDPDKGQEVKTEVGGTAKSHDQLTAQNTSYKVPPREGEQEEVDRRRGGKTEEEVVRQHQRVDRVGVRQLPEGCGEQEKMRRAGCEVASGAPNDPYGKVR